MTTDSSYSSHPWHMHLLVSSMSAHGHAATIGPSVVKTLRAAGWKVSVSVTTAEDTPHLVASASTAPFVAALGGDGYISQVAQGIKGSDAIFVPLPGGRGNDLCRALGLSADPMVRAEHLASILRDARQDTHSDEAATERLAAHIRDVDALWVEEDDKPARLAMGIVSLGFDSTVNQIANESGLKSGPLVYGYAALVGFRRYRERVIHALVDGEQRNLSGWIAAVSNSGMFGGGIRFVPTSDVEDGRMELVHVGSATKPVILRALMNILRRRSAEHPLISVAQVDHIRFTEPVGVQAWADGDPIATVPFSVRTEKGAIRMLA